MTPTLALPPLIVSERDYARLSELALRAEARMPQVASFLARELERATVVPPEDVPPDVVTMGSRFVFRLTDAGGDREAALVYPAEADMAAGRLSVLTPVGAALLGLSAGQVMPWADRTGEARSLVVERVLAQP